MLENYLLEELVTFARVKTLAQTAAALNVTQPTITRGMQKLEEELAVKLFDRQPNRITLTATGQRAAQEADQLLASQEQAITRIRNYDRSLTTLTVETTLPGPLVLLNHLQAQLPPNLAVHQDLIGLNQIKQRLTDQTANLIFSNQELASPTIESRFLGYENLLVRLQKFMYQANQLQITFNELKGLSFIVLTDIGIWREIIQQSIPDAKFLYQPQRSAFMEITKYSDFPYFTTNLTPLDPRATRDNTDDNRVTIPISDPQAHMPIYATYLTSQRTVVKPILDQLNTAWPGGAHPE